MSGDELSVLLRSLDTAPVEPCAQLQEELAPRLLHELERPRWRDRFQLPRVRARVQQVAMAAAGLLATAGVVAAIWLVVRELQTPSLPIIDDPSVVESPTTIEDNALTTVLAARARWLSDPRPVHLVSETRRVEDSGVTSTTAMEIWVRDDTAWRTSSTTEVSDGPTTTVTHVWDGARQLSIGTWGDGDRDAELSTFQATGRHPWGTPTEEWLDNTYSWQRRCVTGEVLDDTEVAGRPAHHVRCGQEHLWLDVQTGLLLRRERPAGVDDFDPAHVNFAVTSVDYDPVFGADLFSTDPPAGIDISEFAEPPHVLETGQPAPAFDAMTADGQPFTLEALRGRHVLVVFWSPGLYDLGVVEQVHRADYDGLAIVVYDGDRDRMAEHARYVAERSYTVPIVFDTQLDASGRSPIAIGWREPPGGPVDIEGQESLAQFWVLVGTDGRVLATRSGTFVPEHLVDWLTMYGVIETGDSG